MRKNYYQVIYIALTLIFCSTFKCAHCLEAFPGNNKQEASNFDLKSESNKTEISISSSSGIVGAFVFPHGGLTLDAESRDYSKESASGEKTKERSVKLNRAMKMAAKELVTTKPDLIIFTTPHGLLLQKHFLILGSAQAGGSIEEGKKYSAEFDLDFNSSLVLCRHLRHKNNSVELLTLGIGGDTLPIRWAEIIPWIFIKEAADEVNFKLPPVVLIGVPVMNATTLIKFGNDIYTIIGNEIAQKRIAIVVSGDLSHYHSNALSSPYPYNKNAQPFDDYCVQWAKLDRSRQTEENSTNILIRQAGDIANSAGSCAYGGLVILHGILSESVKNGNEYRSNFYEYCTPSYFGMMVTSWLPV